MNKQDQQFWEQCAIATVQAHLPLSEGSFQMDADFAFNMADAMLSERNNRPKQMRRDTAIG